VIQPATLQVGGRLFGTIDPVGGRVGRLRLVERTHRATLTALRALASDPRIARVEPNYLRRPFRVPNDSHYVLQWNLKAVHMEQAWDTTTGSTSIVVAVVDTGILAQHPDLQGRLVDGYDFISDPQSAADGDGWDADPHDEGTDSATSSAFHGTWIAGAIGATSNNLMGIAGVDWRCKIQPVRVLGVKNGSGKDTDIAAGIRWAAGVPVPNVPPNKTPAQVICIPFGGPGRSVLLNKAIKDAQDRGAIVVASAGNGGGSVSNIHPAVVPGVVTVGATQLDGKRAPYSNYGPEIDIMGPGGNMTQKLPFEYQNTEWYAGILGTSYKTKDKVFAYTLDEGTSNAAALVSGVISLMLGIDRSLDSATTIRILKQTADRASQCKEGCGAGLVDAAAALSSVANGVAGSGSDPGSNPDLGENPPESDFSDLPQRAGCACEVHGAGPSPGLPFVLLLVLLVIVRLRPRRS
jgi:serine protease